VARAVSAASRSGSSVGIARVTEPGELGDALEGAFAHDDHVLVEAPAGSREVECTL